MLYGLKMNDDGQIMTVIAAADTLVEMAAFPRKADKFKNLVLVAGEVDFYQKIMKFSEVYGMPATYTHRSVSDQDEFIAHMGLLISSDIIIQNKSQRLAVDEAEFVRAIEAEAYREARYKEILEGEVNTAKRGKTLAELADIVDEDRWTEEVNEHNAISAKMYAEQRRKDGKLTGNSFKEIKDGLMIDRINYDFDENGNPIFTAEVSKFTEQGKKAPPPTELDLSPEGMAAFVHGEPAQPARIEGAVYLTDAERLLDMDNMDNMDLVHEITSNLGLSIDELPKARAIKIPSDIVPGIFHEDGQLVPREDFREGFNIGAMSDGVNFHFMVPDPSNPFSVFEIRKGEVRYFLIK